MFRSNLFFLILAFAFFPTHAQENTSVEKLNYIRFLKLTIDDGLTDNSCKEIYKDSYGFVWFGTLDGLNKYDGHEFTTYRFNPDDSLTLSNNYITTIAEDGDRNLWIGTNGGGVNFYDRKKDKITQRFTTYARNAQYRLTSNIIQALLIKNNDLWIGTENGGIQKISIPTKHVQAITKPGLPTSIYRIVQRNDDRFWLVNNTPGSISLFDPETFTIQQWSDFDNSGITINQYIKKVIYPESDSVFWLGTEGEGIFKIKFDELNQQLIKLKHFCTQNNNLGHNIITGILKDDHQNLWITSDGGGVNIIPPSEDTFVEQRRSEDDKYSLSTNAVYEIYKDDEGNIWLGTFTGGINYYYAKTQKFTHFRKKNYLTPSLSYNQILTVAKNQDGLLMIGTDGGGINIFDPGSLKFKVWEEFDIPEFNIVKSILQDDKGHYWIGTYRFGLYHFDENRDLLKVYRHNENDTTSISHNSIWKIFQDSNGKIWLGTLGGGLCIYQPKTDDFIRITSNPNNKNHLSNNVIRAIEEDKVGNIWVGTPNGLNKIDTYYNITNYYHSPNNTSLSNNDVRCLFIDTQGRVLIGTKGGLNIFDNNETFTSFGQGDGLPGEVIYGIEEDNKGNYWITTSNKGLTKASIHLQPDKSWLECINFEKKDGLQSNQFMYASTVKTDKGNLFFGGVEGFNFFDPDKIKSNADPIKVIFTRLSVIDDNSEQTNNSNYLSSHISVADEIRLPYHHNIFTIDFSALNYSQSKNIKYSTFLEGFNENWQPASIKKSVSFTNLNHGDYVLKVKATNQDGVWSDEISSIKILIIPPWYMTIWARVLFGFILLYIIFGAIRYRISRLTKQKEALQFLVEDQTEELKNANVLLKKNQVKITDQNEDLKVKIKHIGDQQKRIETQNEELKRAQKKLDKANKDLKNVNQTLEERVKIRTHELEKSNEELDRFVYSASHDISAPLKSLMGLISLARTDQDLKNIMSYIDHMEISVHRLDDVITNLIQYSQNTKKKILKSNFNVKKVIVDVVESLHFLNNAKETIDFQIDIDDSLEILFDETRLRIIVNNLISNSIKYHYYKREHCYIKISFVQVKQKCTLVVEDNGIGIANDFKENIFNMFFRATGNSTGAGLGLFIVKETIDKVKGKIHLESTEGKGTKISVELPLI